MSELSKTTSTDTKDIEEISLELVTKIRRLHFQEGSSQSIRTRQAREHVEKYAKLLKSNAT